MRGQWIEAASRRLFSAESFALLIEPAIADLQLDESPRLAARMDAYRTVWIGMAAACDASAASRIRAFVRENDLLSLTGLALLHAAHSVWMIVLLLGLDGRGRHLGKVIADGWNHFSPGFLAAASVIALYGGRALARYLLAKRRPADSCSIVRVVE
jgi:hypothetical protein